MSNYDFFTLLNRHINDGVVVYLKCTKTLPGFNPCKVGNRILFVQKDCSSFIETIIEKNLEGEFLTQHQAEVAFSGTHSLISGLVTKGDLMVISSNGVKFYVRKNW